MSLGLLGKFISTKLSTSGAKSVYSFMKPLNTFVEGIKVGSRMSTLTFPGSEFSLPGCLSMTVSSMSRFLRFRRVARSGGGGVGVTMLNRELRCEVQFELGKESESTIPQASSRCKDSSLGISNGVM